MFWICAENNVDNTVNSSLLLSRAYTEPRPFLLLTPPLQRAVWQCIRSWEGTPPGQLTRYDHMTSWSAIKLRGRLAGGPLLGDWLRIGWFVVSNCFHLYHLSFLGFISLSFLIFFFTTINCCCCYYYYNFYYYMPSFSIHTGTGMTLTPWYNAEPVPIYWSACVVIYIFHICTRDHAYSDRPRT